MTQLPVDSGVRGVHWQVSQATSIYNLRVEMSKDPNTQHIGMDMENGSGGYMGDMIFNGCVLFDCITCRPTYQSSQWQDRTPAR